MEDKELKGTELNELDEDEQEQAQLLRAVLGTYQHYFGSMEQMFEGVKDVRIPELTEYSLEVLFFTGILMFLCQLGARRQIKHKLRGNGSSKAKIKALLGVDEIPHGDTLNYGFKKLVVAEVQEVVCWMVAVLIRKKVLSRWRLLNKYYLIAIDGTGMLVFSEKHCEHCLNKKLRNGKTLYYHPQVG